MSFYPISPSEASLLKERLLVDPEFKEEFIKMKPVQEIVDDLLTSVRLPKTHATYLKKRNENEQKVYEIVCFTLRKKTIDIDIKELEKEEDDVEEENPLLEEKEAIRLDDHFWHDVRNVVQARASQWNLSSKLKQVIEAYKNGDAEPLKRYIDPICASRLWKILSSNDEGVVQDMVDMVCRKLSSSNLLNNINYPGALPYYIFKTVNSLFNKYPVCNITECFPNSEYGTPDYDPKKVGYAHLTLKAYEERLINLLGYGWYQWYLQDPFCDSVVEQYQPYAKNPSYASSAAKNRIIENEVNNVLSQLKEQFKIGRRFPASGPSVEYNKTDSAGNSEISRSWKPIDTSIVFAEKVTKALTELIPDLKPGEDIVDEDIEREESKVEVLAREKDTYFEYKFRTNRVEEMETIDKFNRALNHILDPWEKELLMRSTLNGENSVSIGRSLCFRDPPIESFKEEQVKKLKTKKPDGKTPDEIFDEQLEIAVNSNKDHIIKRKLRPKMGKLLYDCGEVFDGKDMDILLSYFERIDFAL